MRRHGWIRHMIHDFETNPKVQFKFHVIMMVFWLVNAVVGTFVMLAFPGAWVTIGVFYVFLLSIYANWDTDMDALSASLAAMHAETLMNHLGIKVSESGDQPVSVVVKQAESHVATHTEDATSTPRA